MAKDRDPGPLGSKLAALREQAGITLYELEKRSGINRPKLMRIETGEIRQPTTETLNKLAAALEVDPEEFFDAAWAESDGPLPSLPTYFRSKFHLTDEQIAAVERTIKRIEQKPDRSKSTNKPKSPTKGGRS